MTTDFVFGIRPVQEILQSDKEIDKLLIQKGIQNQSIAELVQSCRQRHIPVVQVPEEKLRRITRKNHQGVICLLSAVTFASLDHIISQTYATGKLPLLVALDRVTDVRNVGAIARSAECAGAQALVLPERGTARLGGDAFKASAGALSHLPVCREKSLRGALHFLKNNGLQVVACTEKGTTNIYRVDFTAPTAMLLGSEEDGISTELLALADVQAFIPMVGKIASLNVSVAAGICLFEALRQRQEQHS
ncbi:MAG: 23S rRNA (guanosine(2251)-2'-O)-methyltransferase RlmB [Cytophagales bacterium]|nr:23S rRNA (guanosine(2251)-2'-O)-methyltransferase RlmB [Bernardetiaceae bacterium]MDW8204138.1 23S rRNA (guanosine(2251)-2'-O)-methyltransferase RlmB [Cytophagales bacterium]